MKQLKKNYFIIIKYIYLTICFICFFNYFASTLPQIDSLIVFIRSYLPILGVILLLFTKNINFKINNTVLLLLVLSYCFATCIGNEQVFNEIIILFILGYMFSNENPRQLFKYIFCIFIVFMTSNLILSHFNIYEYKLVERSNSSIRHAFNFFYPNYLGLYCLSSYCLICYVLNKFKLIIIPSGIILFLFTYYYVDSRTSALMILLLMLIHIFYWIFSPLFNKLNISSLSKYVKLIVIALPTICLLFSIIITIAYDSDNFIINKLDSLLTGRLGLQYSAFTKYNIPLLGNQIIFNVNGYDIIDNFYMFIIYKFGLLFELALISFISYKLFANRNKYSFFSLSWIIITWSIYGISEPTCLYFCCNPFLLLLFNNYQEENIIDELEGTHE